MKMSKSYALIEAAKKSYEYWAELARLDFSTLLGEAMEGQGITKKQLAEKTAVSRAYISKVLGGEAVNFTLKSMAKLMFALGQRVRFVAEPINEKAPKNLEQLYVLARAKQKQPGGSGALYIPWDSACEGGAYDHGQLYPPQHQEDAEYKEALAA